MKTLTTFLVLVLASSAEPLDTNEIKLLEIDCSITTIVRQGRFVAYSGIVNPIVLDVKLRKSLPETYDKALQIFGPAFVDGDSGTGTCQWTFDDHRTLSCSFPISLTAKIVNLKLSDIQPSMIIPVVEQDAAPNHFPAGESDQ